MIENIFFGSFYLILFVRLQKLIFIKKNLQKFDQNLKKFGKKSN